MEEWKQVMANGEETNQLIEKFSKMDTARAENLEAKRKALQTKITERRNRLINLIEEYRSLEQILDRTSQLFRQCHMERRNLVNTWKDAITHMNERELDIKNAEMEIEKAEEYTKVLKEELKAQEEFLEQQQRNNFEVELSIKELNVQTSKLRNRLTELSDLVALKTNEYSAMRKGVQSLSAKLTNMRNKNRQYQNEESEKRKLIEDGAVELEKLKDKYDNFNTKNMCAQERLKQLVEIVEAEEKNIRVLNDETARKYNESILENSTFF